MPNALTNFWNAINPEFKPKGARSTQKRRSPTPPMRFPRSSRINRTTRRKFQVEQNREILRARVEQRKKDGLTIVPELSPRRRMTRAKRPLGQNL